MRSSKLSASVNRRRLRWRAKSVMIGRQVAPRFAQPPKRQMENHQNSFAPLHERAFIIFFACALILNSFSLSAAQQKSSSKPAPLPPIPTEVMLKIVRAEDERRYD